MARSAPALGAGFDQAVKEFRAGFGLVGAVVGEGERFGGEEGFEVATHRRPGEIGEIGNDSVRRKNGQTFTVSVDEGHHGELMGS
jgi:hypothetical protein